MGISPPSTKPSPSRTPIKLEKQLNDSKTLVWKLVSTFIHSQVEKIVNNNQKSKNRRRLSQKKKNKKKKNPRRKRRKNE
jgi:hypothetical protein